MGWWQSEMRCGFVCRFSDCIHSLRYMKKHSHRHTHTLTLYMPGIVQHEKRRKKKKKKREKKRKRKLHKLHHSTLGTTLNKPRWGRHSNNRATTVTTFLMGSSHGQWCTGGNSDKTSHNNGAPDSSASTL